MAAAENYIMLAVMLDSLYLEYRRILVINFRGAFRHFVDFLYFISVLR